MSSMRISGAVLAKSIVDKIHNSTWEQTRFSDVAEPYGVLDELRDVSVTPQLEKLDFYDGSRIPRHSYTPFTSRARWELEENRGSKEKQAIQLPDLLNEFKKGQITFIGPAGSGKTTLLKSLARDFIGKKYDGLRDVQVVHFMQCRDIQSQQMVTAGEMLFRNSETMLTEDEMKQTVDFIKNNSSKVVFVIDSLDTLRYNLSEMGRVSGTSTRNSPGVIMWNLLSGKIFPGTRVITSSREYAIRNYMGDLRADKVFALNGLTNDSMRKIVAGYLGEKKAAEVMEKLRTSSPALLQLCETPVFLVFTLIGLQAESSFNPSTMSGIMVLLLQSLLHSEHARKRNVTETLDKLKYFSFVGTNESRVVFATDELEKFRLQEDEITDLAIVAPGGRPQRLLENHFDYFYFCHQSVQEVLTAFYIAEMDLPSYSTFIDDYIHQPQYAIVRRMLCGAILDDDVLDASTGLVNVQKDLESKQKILKRSLETELSRVREGGDRLELYISMHEAMDAMIDAIKKISVIELYSMPLLQSDVHAIGEIVQRCERLEDLWLYRCFLNPRLLNILATCIQGSSVKIRFLNLTEVKVSTREDIVSILKILPNVTEVVRLWGWTISESNRHFLQEQLDILSFTEFKIESIWRSPLSSSSVEIVSKTRREMYDALRKKKVVEIGTEEVSVAMDGFEATFPSGSLVDSTVTTLSLVIDSELWPEGYIAVSPMLACDPPVDLLVPARIKLPTWCSTTSSEVVVYEMEQLDENADWIIKNTTPLQGMTAGLEIQRRRVARHQGFVKKEHLNSLQYLAKIDIYYQQQSLFSVTLYASDETINRSCLQELKQQKFERAYLMSKPMLLQGGDKTKVSMTCRNAPDYTFTPSVQTFHLNDVFSKSLREYFSFKLRPLPSLNQSLKLRLTTQADSEESDIDFDLLWPESVKEIDSNGGNFDAEGCRIRFPVGAVEERTYFKLARATSHELWLDGFMAITSIFTLTPALEFRVPIKLQLTPWCKPATENVAAWVMTKKSMDSDWQRATTLLLSPSSSEIEFEARNFIRAVAVVKNTSFSGMRYSVSTAIYYNPEVSDFSFVIVPKGAAAKTEDGRDMVAGGFKIISATSSSMELMNGDEVEVTLECIEPKYYTFGPVRTKTFKMSDQFGHDMRSMLQFKLQPTPRPKELLRVHCAVNHNGVSKKCEFQVNWIETAEGPTPGRHHFYEPVKTRETSPQTGARAQLSTDPTQDTRHGFKIRSTGETESVIGPEGGALVIGECQVIFPKGAVAKRTRFQMRLAVDNDNWPEDYIGISPLLICEPSMTFLLPVTFRIPTWCLANSSTVMVYVMTQEGGSPRQTIRTFPLSDMNRLIEFECNHFSRFWSFIRRLLFGEVRYLTKVGLYYHQQGNFTALVYVDNDTILDSCENELLEKGFESAPVLLNPITLKEGDKIKVTMRCQFPDAHNFSPNHIQGFTLTDDFANSLHAYFSFKIRPRPIPRANLEIQCQVERNTDCISAADFNLEWPEQVPIPFAKAKSLNHCQINLYGKGSTPSPNVLKYKEVNMTAKNIVTDHGRLGIATETDRSKIFGPKKIQARLPVEVENEEVENSGEEPTSSALPLHSNQLTFRQNEEIAVEEYQLACDSDGSSASYHSCEEVGL